MLDSQANDGLQINPAGRQRILSQRMSKEALLIAGAEDEVGKTEARARLAATVGLFDRTLTALADGGTTVGGTGGEVALPPAEDLTVIESLNVGRETWEQAKPYLEMILDPGTPVGSPVFDEAIALSLLAGMGTLWVLKVQIGDPLQVAVRFAKSVASGDLTVQITSSNNSEIGELMQTLDDMANCLVNSVDWLRIS